MENPQLLCFDSIFPVVDDKSQNHRTFAVQCIQATSLLGPLLVMSLQLLIFCSLLDLSSTGLGRWQSFLRPCGLCWLSVYKALFVLLVVIVVTWVFTFLYLTHYTRSLIPVYAAIVGIVLGFVTAVTTYEIAAAFDFALDIFSGAILVWNIAVILPYIIVNPLVSDISTRNLAILSMSASITLLILFLDEATTWLMVAFMTIWDVYAVSHPSGPISLILQQRQERIYMGEKEAAELPLGLVFSTKYYEIGTMDLIFLGLIVGRGIVSQSYCTFFACVLSVLIGFMATCLHAIVRHYTVPALPAALSIGVAVYAICTAADIQAMMSSIIRNGVYF